MSKVIKGVCNSPPLFFFGTSQAADEYKNREEHSVKLEETKLRAQGYVKSDPKLAP